MRVKLMFLMGLSALGGLAQTGSPTLRVGTFNTNGTNDAAFVVERVTAMATELTKVAQTENLGVMCLNDLRDTSLRDIALQGFRNDPNWYIYQPPRKEQPGCKNACSKCQSYSFNGLIYPINKWVQHCTQTVDPVTGKSCGMSTNEGEYSACMAKTCPFLSEALKNYNPSCNFCLSTPIAGEDLVTRAFRCSSTFNEDDAANCTYGYGGEAGGTIVSRYPFTATEYHEFTEPHGYLQFGSANRGIAYGKIQTPSGPVHLFCANPATSTSAMNPRQDIPPAGCNGSTFVPGLEQSLNVTESQEILTYMQTKANGEMAVLLGDTGNGPAVATSPTGPANAQWLPNFTILQGGLTDALLANVMGNSLPSSAAACTAGCSVSTPDAARYVDHVMTSGKGTTPQGAQAGFVHSGGGTFFTAPIVNTSGGLIPLSDHFGVRTDLSVGAPAYQLSLSDNGSPAHTFGQGSIGKIATATLTTSGADTSGVVTVSFTISSGLAATGLAGPNGSWSCSGLSCSTSSSVTSGSLLTFALTFNVAANASSPQSVSASVSGGLGLTVSAGPVSLTITPVSNVSGSVKVTQNGFVRNRTTGLWAGTMTVQNTSTVAIAGPLQVVLTNLPNGVAMTNGSGVLNGSPYITVVPTGQSLAPGASASASIQFSNPGSVSISFTPVALTGVI